ncbi:MAG: DnaJ domain-containing protein [Candidatus Aenigmarchaeota archaeon]|nr:DnaJ domain-containing protein [Candidatus Aenigmarchaeota archaeon]
MLDKIIQRTGYFSEPIVARAAVERFRRENHIEPGDSHPKDYYGLLGLERSAEDYEIGEAYRTAAKRNHPDVKGGSGVAMKIINTAREVLSDPDKRQVYDRFSGVRSGGINADVAGQDIDWTEPERFLTETGYSALADLSRLPSSTVRLISFWQWLLKENGGTLPESLITGSQIAETLLGYLGREAAHDRIVYRGAGDRIAEGTIFLPQIVSSLLTRLAMGMIPIDQRTGRPKDGTLGGKMGKWGGAILYTIAQLGNMIPYNLIAQGLHEADKSRGTETIPRPNPYRSPRMLPDLSTT